METSSSSLKLILEATGVVGDPYKAGGHLIGSSLLGLIIIIGTFLYHRSNLSLFRRSCVMSCSRQENSLMSVQLVFTSLMILLITDTVNVIMAIIFAFQIIRSFCYDTRSFVYIGIVCCLSKWFGVIIHLLNASLSISHLCHQSLSEIRVCIVYSLIGLLIGIMIPLYLYVPGVALVILAASMFGFALSVIVVSLALTSSPSTSTLKKLIVLVAMCNFLVVYVPNFIAQCLLFTSNSFDEFVNYKIGYVNVLYFTNHHFVFDGFLCTLILKLPSGEEQQEQHQQLQQLISSNPGFTASPTVNQQ